MISVQELRRLQVPPDLFRATDLAWKTPAELRGYITVSGVSFGEDRTEFDTRQASAYDAYMTAATTGAPVAEISARKEYWARHELGSRELMRRVDEFVQRAALEGRWIGGGFWDSKVVLIRPQWWRFLKFDLEVRHATDGKTDLRDIRFIVSRDAPHGFCKWLQRFFEAAPQNGESVVNAPEFGTSGRPPKHDWAAFDIEIMQIANTSPDGLPERSVMHRYMMNWWQETGREEPSEIQVRDRLSRIYRELKI